MSGAADRPGVHRDRCGPRRDPERAAPIVATSAFKTRMDFGLMPPEPPEPTRLHVHHVLASAGQQQEDRAEVQDGALFCLDHAAVTGTALRNGQPVGWFETDARGGARRG
jgi:hypothetical protein